MPKTDENASKKAQCCNMAKYHIGVWGDIYPLLSDDMKRMLNEEWDKANAIAARAEGIALESLEP